MCRRRVVFGSGLTVVVGVVVVFAEEDDGVKRATQEGEAQRLHMSSVAARWMGMFDERSRSSIRAK